MSQEGSKRGGRPRERIYLDDDQEAVIAKDILKRVEEVLSMSANEVAKQLHVSPKTWRSYKAVGEPGPPPHAIIQLEALLSESEAAWVPGELAAAWGVEFSDPSNPQPVVRSLKVGRAVIGLVAILLIGTGIRIWLQARPSISDEEAGQLIEIYNKVVYDESRMREDVPAYLTTSPDCAALSTCGIDGALFVSGDVIQAVCYATGIEITNRFGEVENPENYSSDLWYGVEYKGTFGYISEVWIQDAHRGGLGLRECIPSG